MNAFFTAMRGMFGRVRTIGLVGWTRFRSLRKRTQVVSAVGVTVLLIALIVILGQSTPSKTHESVRSVVLRSVGELSLGNGGSSVFGSVRSLSEAALMAKTSGTVEAVHTSIGASVPANFIIAELENASERASVLQAQGAYDAALAARGGTDADGANTYRSTYTTLDTTLETYVDTFYGSPGPYGPRFLIPVGSDNGIVFAQKRKEIRDLMYLWQKNISSSSADPGTLLADAETTTHLVSDLLLAIAKEANKTDSSASEAQLTALATARTAVDGVLASLASARDAYRSGGGSASADASVKQALGTLRLAEANLERTRVRAPIAGTVNFLPIRVGDYVTVNTPVATVAQNAALEIIAFVSEDTSETLQVGMQVLIEDNTAGVITSIAPALDPITKQIELRIAVTDANTLTNGQSVRVGLPATTVSETNTDTSPIMLPLASVKLTTGSRVVFIVNAENHLVAVPVEIGEVRGERIEILSGLARDARIVTDARGLSDGQEVNVITQ